MTAALLAIILALASTIFDPPAEEAPLPAASPRAATRTATAAAAQSLSQSNTRFATPTPFDPAAGAEPAQSPSSTSYALPNDFNASPFLTPQAPFSSSQPYSAGAGQALFTTYTVQQGETLESIAAQFETTAGAIAAASFLAEPNLVWAGEELAVPLVDLDAYQAAESQPALAGGMVGDGESAVLGYSLMGHPLELYRFGSGPRELLFVGGTHGGWEWNTTVLAYEVIEMLAAEPELVPADLTVFIIPAANPDGIYAVSGREGPISSTHVFDPYNFASRFNANGVDLNRNWDCEWSPKAYWQDRLIGAGSGPFSEVESRLLRDFILGRRYRLEGVIFWHSQASIVSPGHCGEEPHGPSTELASAYAAATDYTLWSFSAYEISGDASNWLASLGIPSFAVELHNHYDIDWRQNRAGVLAVIKN